MLKKENHRGFIFYRMKIESSNQKKFTMGGDVGRVGK